MTNARANELGLVERAAVALEAWRKPVTDSVLEEEY